MFLGLPQFLISSETQFLAMLMTDQANIKEVRRFKWDFFRGF